MILPSPNADPAADEGSGSGTQWGCLDTDAVSLTQKLLDAGEAEERQTDLHTDVGLYYDISEVEKPSGHGVQFHTAQLVHGHFGDFTRRDHDYLHYSPLRRQPP